MSTFTDYHQLMFVMEFGKSLENEQRYRYYLSPLISSLGEISIHLCLIFLLGGPGLALCRKEECHNVAGRTGCGWQCTI